MRIYKTADYESMSRKAASILAAQIVSKPDSVLGLATGSTPEGAYRYLAEWYSKGLLDFSQIRTVNLDEYKGLGPDHPQGYRYFMNQHLFRLVNIRLENTFVPNGLEPDSRKACEEFETVLAELGGVDLQLLGMGHNGHIGFNEPGSVFPVGCHCADLDPRTLQANGKYFEDPKKMPRQAYSMGVGTIMHARKILLAVSGAEKAESLAKALTGPVTPELPASILQFHPDVTVVADEAALSRLP